MSNNFNGQINISRDLRKNKQVVIGKYDLTDIIFLMLGFGVAIIVAYLLGFSSLKVVDEFSAILIAIFPMLLIISLGFKRTAGIRQFNYMRMKQLDKKSRVRFNRNKDNSFSNKKYILGIKIEKKYLNRYLNKFLNDKNIEKIQVRYLKDEETNKNVIYILLSIKYQNKQEILNGSINEYIFNDDYLLLSDEIIGNLQKDLNLKFIKKVIIESKIQKFIKNQVFKRLNIKIKEKEIEIDNKYLDKKFKIYMLNLYDNKIYRRFINKVKRYSDVICYFKREGKKRFVNTFLLIEDEIKKGKKLTKIEKVDKLCMDFGVIVDKLTNEQVAGRNAISYLMTNPFNNYRLYK